MSGQPVWWVLVQALLIGRVVARFGERVTAAFGLSFAIIAMLCYAFIESASFALWFCLLVGIQGMVMPSLNAMMSRRTPSDSQGELQGFNGSLAALAALISPLIYNTSLAYYTNEANPTYFPGAPFLLAAIIATIALVCLIRLEPVHPSEPVGSSYS